MGKVILLLLVLSMQCVSVFAQQQLIINGNVQITIPEELKFSSQKDRKDSTFLAESGGKPSLSYRVASDSITDNEIPAYTDDLLKLAKSESKNYEYLDDGIHLQDGKNIGYIKFSGKEGRRTYFYYTFFISVDNKPLILKFSCPFKQWNKWESEVEKIAKSLRIIK